MANVEKTLHTKNIVQSIKEFAEQNSLNPASLDFTLLGVQTYFKNCHLDTFVKFHDDYKNEYTDEHKIIKDHVRFVQIYKIKIHAKKPSPLKLDYRIDYGEFSSHPIMVLFPTSILPLSKTKELELLKLLYKEINKIKAFNGMLINLFAETMLSDLKNLISKIYKDGFDQDETILLFEGIPPIVSKPSEVINHYKDKQQGEKVAEVEDAELIITYLKPVYGDAGLNVKGQRIYHGDTNNHAKIEYQIDKASIRVHESPTEIRYYAKKRGFVSTFNNTLSISNKIILENLKRSEGTLTKKEENEVAVIISQNDVTRDSVGEGVELVSESIHITGHMGAKSRIEAKECVIDGATHNLAFVTAKNVKINRHKGTLRCHKAEINSLEGGTVYATHALINNALGGQVCAEHVTIKSLKHNLKVFASKSITIERILGEDNHFVIDYRKLPVLQSKLQFLNEEREDLAWKYEDAKKHSAEKLPDIKAELQHKDDEIQEIKLSHYDAVITIMAPINGLNTIEFAVPEEHNSLIYRTKDAKHYEPFSLQIGEEQITLNPVNVTIQRS